MGKNEFVRPISFTFDNSRGKLTVDKQRTVEKVDTRGSSHGSLNVFQFIVIYRRMYFRVTIERSNIRVRYFLQG